MGSRCGCRGGSGACQCVIASSSSVEVTGSGTTAAPWTPVVRISGEVGNGLTVRSDGVYVSAGGGNGLNRLGDLSDVELGGDGGAVPAHGDGLRWDIYAQRWVAHPWPDTQGGGAAVLNDLGDVDTVTTGPAVQDDVLAYNAATGNYEPTTLVAGNGAAGKDYGERVAVLFPGDGIRNGYGFWMGSSAIHPLPLRCSASLPFRPSEDSLITGVTIQVTTGAAGNTHLLALYDASDSGTPGDLVHTFPAFLCDTAGYKEHVGLSVPISEGQVYVFGSLAGPNSPDYLIRGHSTGTTGMSIDSVGPVTGTALLSPGGDNLFRGEGFRYNAVTPVAEVSPTWIMDRAGIHIPNIGLTTVAA